VVEHHREPLATLAVVALRGSGRLVSRRAVVTGEALLHVRELEDDLAANRNRERLGQLVRNALHALGVRRDALAKLPVTARDRFDELSFFVVHGEREAVELFGDEETLRNRRELALGPELLAERDPLAELRLADGFVERAH